MIYDVNLVGKLIKFSLARHLLAILLGLAVLLPMAFDNKIVAASGERTLYLYYTHTNETKRITFRRNGRYVQSGLNELNQFLRDWRRNEPTKMDPALFDLIWTVYRDVGATKPISVVSAYRSPQTNEMLRSRSSAVAKNSRHTMGMAMDIYIPGISVSKIRKAAMRLQVGGVGYYPSSNHPFVHLDTGNVRAWPRMTRNQLAQLFPNGKTLHLASDGSVLSAAGRRYAEAQWAKCHSVPCNGSNSITAPSRSSGGGSNSNSGSGHTLMDLFFGNAKDDVTTTVVAANAPTRRTVTAVAVIPPTPAARAAFLDNRDPIVPPIPATMSEPMFVATHSVTNNLQSNGIDPIAVASIPEQSTRPAPRVLLSTESSASSNLLAAYAPVMPVEPDAQRALEMLIERRNNNPVTTPGLRGTIVTASLGPVPTISPSVPLPNPASNPAIESETQQNEFANLFSGTFQAVEQVHPANEPALQTATLALSRSTPIRTNLPITMRKVEFYAPELEDLSGSMTMPDLVAGDRYAIRYEPDESNFNPSTELGPQSGQIVFTLSEIQPLQSNRFTHIAPVILTNT